MSERELTTQRRKRGVIKASITRLQTKIKDIEFRPGDPNTPAQVRQIQGKLKELDSAFKDQHFAVLELIEGDDEFYKEQDVLDKHDDEMALLTVAVERLLATISGYSPINESTRGILLRRLRHSQKKQEEVAAKIQETIEETSRDLYFVHHCEQESQDHKRELAELRNELLALDINEDDELNALLSSLEQGNFETLAKIRKALYDSHKTSTDSSMLSEGKGVKLPKIDVPKFDGSILSWQTFWEQFAVSVDNQTTLSEAEKLAYLRSSLMDGSAKHAIEGLSHTGECYKEAIECLKSRYNRPRLIHQTHVRMIVEAPPLKEGNGKELRRLHDTVLQHLRALKAMELEPSGPFITSILELKLDANTMFEWQRHSQDSLNTPHYRQLLEFLNVRAQASEALVTETKKEKSFRKGDHFPRDTKKPIVSYATSIGERHANDCVCCSEKHPLYICNAFKSLSHAEKLSTLKSNNFCHNCLRPGHILKDCKSIHRCRICQKPHHTLLHIEIKPNIVSSHAALGSGVLLMTLRSLVKSPTGQVIEARGLLDCGSSASFISRRLTQLLKLPCKPCNAKISGVGGLSHPYSMQNVTSFNVAPIHCPDKEIHLSAIVIPRVTCDLPVSTIHSDPSWSHLRDIRLADPQYGKPGRIDFLLGVDIFTSVIRQGRRFGPAGSPAALETEFGWVLAGGNDSSKNHEQTTVSNVITHHVTTTSCDDLLRKFWEIEEKSTVGLPLSQEEKIVAQSFDHQHSRNSDGSFVVPLPKGQQFKALGESRSKAVRRFISLERSLHAKDQFGEFSSALEEYFHMGHAERVPEADLQKPPSKVFYLPMHAVRKDSSTTTKLRVVFDGSAKTSTGISLNDTMLIGQTVHSSLIDVLLRFRLYKIALITDVSKMYRAVHLAKDDKDLHRFVWRNNPQEPLVDYRMTRITFGVSASSHAANMSIKQNSLELAEEYPLAARAVKENFYVDDGLSGGSSVQEVVELQRQLHESFEKGGFKLHKWNSSDPRVMEHLPSSLKGNPSSCTMPEPEYTKTLGIRWSPTKDHFQVTITELPPVRQITKRFLVSDVAKTFDVLGWFSPSIIVVKILLQRLWELQLGWDDQLPSSIIDSWFRWRSELKLLETKSIPRCYFRKDSEPRVTELHGFCDASESAYAAVVYFRTLYSDGSCNISLIAAKTKVAPIKRLTIPRLELCGAVLLARLMHHLRTLFDVPLENVYSWTDSTVVLGWIKGSSRRFKIFVGNRVSELVDCIPTKCWRHVNGIDNPADCASRGLQPSELLSHDLWWNGPQWLKTKEEWPEQRTIPIEDSGEECSISLISITCHVRPILSFNRYSSYTKLKLVTAWLFRFLNNVCLRGEERTNRNRSSCLSIAEIMAAETHLLLASQREHFESEIIDLRTKNTINRSSCLLTIDPFLDSSGLLRVGGRQNLSSKSYHIIHPIILHGRHPLTKLIIRSEHLRLLHGGPTLVNASLSARFHIVGKRKAVHDVTRQCIRCKRVAAKPQSQKMGNLPKERITPDRPFANVGIDYAGPFYVKYGYVRKPTVVKAYACIFVSLSVKAAHIELVTDLTAEAFIACLRRFVARRGKPVQIMSDNGTNFVGANRELHELSSFLQSQKTGNRISQFCCVENIQWRFIPERAPHFGGIWEAAVKSVKYHLRRVVGDHKLTFEELSTVMAQVEACLNSRPIAPLPLEGEGLEALTPGHFLIGGPLQAIPDPSESYRSIPLLKRWHLVQSIVRHIWQRWSSEYLTTLSKAAKWHSPSYNLKTGDVVLVREDTLITPTRWPLARVVQVYTGADGHVRVAMVKTSSGTYKRPVVKLVPLLSEDD